MSKVLSALGGALPDERPLLSLQIVESVAKCPTGYWPVSRTYDEDADAGLLRQSGLFGKKPSHYICLSKSEGVPGYVMDGVTVVGEREAAPAGYSVAGRAGKRRLCTRVSRHPPPAAPVTDVIVCSRMRTAPEGFHLAGEINGKMVCYKVSGGSADASPTHQPRPADYENVVSHLTPDANRRLRAVPERPPKLSPLVNDLNNLNLKSPSAYPKIEDFGTDHDYEALSPSYVKPVRPAPRPPSGVQVSPAARPANGPQLSPAPRPPHGPQVSPAPRPPHGSPLSPAAVARKKAPAPLPKVSNYQTLGGYNGLEGVPFVLNPKLRGLPDVTLAQLPVIKQRTRFDLDRDYSYNFNLERQT
ncbi:wiskott-Aldrich syndrome protein homolog 1 isoform X2 [Aricia agestis]|uniref:wiskott-Aldrich syndrome protein homolog 1 isoform X2 n=1 Tax=Aricia agestis TaxID=91739 RepID=UPI001C206C89|nr:wiskott-Aldrich syndrome protein homolog 1 isoform X2 [Aricia agestis]